MEKKDNPAYRDLGTAGQNFFVFHLEDILKNFNRFKDGQYKKKKITEYFERQNGFKDAERRNVTSRVNASLRIDVVQFIPTANSANQSFRWNSIATRVSSKSLISRTAALYARNLAPLFSFHAASHLRQDFRIHIISETFIRRFHICMES